MLFVRGTTATFAAPTSPWRHRPQRPIAREGSSCPSPSAGPPRAGAARPSSPRRSRWPAARSRCSSISTVSCPPCSDSPSRQDKASATGWRPMPSRLRSSTSRVAVDRTTSLVPRGTAGVDLASPRWPELIAWLDARGHVVIDAGHHAAAQRARAARRAQPARHTWVLPRAATRRRQCGAPTRHRARRRARPEPASARGRAVHRRAGRRHRQS